MADFILNPTVIGTFPSGASYNLDEHAVAFAQRLSLTLPAASVLLGQLGGTEPLSPLPGSGATPGLWLNGNVLYQWNVDALKYLPLPPVAGQIISGTIFTTQVVCGAHTASTTLTTPDKSGTIATIGDVSTVLGTQTPTGANVTVDWTVKKAVYLVLSANTTIVQSGQVDGQEQDYYIENNGTAWTVTWSGIAWPGAVAPVQTTASAGTRKIDHIGLRQVGDVCFGYVLNNKAGQADYVGAEAAFSITTGTDSTPPTVSLAQGFSATIYITFSELIQGGDMLVGSFIVKKNGNTQVVNSATASGDRVTIVIADTFGSRANLSVQYTGATVKDLSGNLAAAFTTSVVITSSAGGATGTGGGTGNAP